MKKQNQLKKAFSPKRAAFTMAEILLSLAVIGIIAAMTLPTLTANFQDRAFNAKRQALHSRLANAFRTMDYSEYHPIDKRSEDDFDAEGNEIYPKVNKFMDELSKQLSIKVISDPDMIFVPRDFEGNDKNNWYIPIGVGDASNYTFIGGPKAYFQTVNGESVAIEFHSPDFMNAFDKNDPGHSMVGTIVYDLNGKKGPNKWGKDVGIMGVYLYDQIELYAPMPAVITDNIIDDAYVEGDSSTQKYKYPDYRLPSVEELGVLLGYGNMSILPSEYSSSTFCTIEGHKYSTTTLFDEKPSRSDDESECLYMLITNDGSAPKNGVIYDISSEDSGE